MTQFLMRWIIGDIHGMFRMLVALLDAVNKRDGDARFYFVGDYVNRGPESKQVVDLLLTMKGAKFVRGNHDEIFDLVVNGQSFESHPDLYAPVHAFLTFLQFGLDSTLTSYGIDIAMIEHVAHRPSPQALEKLLEPISKAHREFYRALPPVIEEPDLLVAHAKWDPDDPNDEAHIAKLATNPQQRHLIVWGRVVLIVHGSTQGSCAAARSSSTFARFRVIVATTKKRGWHHIKFLSSKKAGH